MCSTKQILLIRHGESLAQASKGFGGKRNFPAMTDCCLSSQGEEQVQQLAGADFLNDVDLVVSSPLSRALETAQGLFNDKPNPPFVL